MIRLSRAQQSIIKRIAREQEESFMRIIENNLFMEAYHSLNENGYDVDVADVLEAITRFMQMWEEVREDPTSFIEVLDDLNMKMIKEHLKHDFGNDRFINPLLKGITDKVDLFSNKPLAN